MYIINLLIGFNQHCMVYAYLRVSTDTQSLENQKYEILMYCDRNDLKIDEWVEEVVSATKHIKDRKVGELVKGLKTEDVLIVSELSRLGRNLMEVMHILHDCMEKQVKVFTIKEKYELGDNLNSKVLAFAFGLSAEIEQQLISQRTKEALARKKSEGKKLGRPKGSLSRHTKLSGKEDMIVELLRKKLSVSAIAKIFEVHRLTAHSFIKSRKLKERVLLINQK